MQKLHSTIFNDTNENTNWKIQTLHDVIKKMNTILNNIQSVVFKWLFLHTFFLTMHAPTPRLST